MSNSSLRLAAHPQTQLSGFKFVQVPPSELRPFQVRCKRDSESEAPKQLRVSRRDAMICLTSLSLNGIGLSSPEIAEARMTKSEIRRKIKEKLELLREKAGFLKQKQKEKEKENEKSPSSKTKVLPLEPPPLPLPSPPPQGSKNSLVEATL